MIELSTQQFARFHHAAGVDSARVHEARTAGGNAAGIAEMNRIFSAKVVVGYWLDDTGKYAMEILKGQEAIARLRGPRLRIDVDELNPPPTFFYTESKAFALRLKAAFLLNPNARWVYKRGPNGRGSADLV